MSLRRGSVFEWSFRAFRIFRTDVRIHWTLALFTAVEVIRWSNLGDRLSVAYALALMAGFWLSILLHELGHIFAARSCGIPAEEVLLWPLGGLAIIGGTGGSARNEIKIAAAGPAVSALLAAFFLGGALAQERLVGWGVLDPYHGWGPEGWSFFTTALCRDLFRTNLIMLLFNVLLPVYPLDGGRILRSVLSTRLGFERATHVTATLGIGASVVLIMIGVGLRDLTLIAIAIWTLVEAWRERALLREGALEGYGQAFLGHDFSMGYTSLERGRERARGRRSVLARLRRMISRARPARSSSEPRGEEPAPRPSPANLRDEVDRLLEKVSRDGLASLAPGERRFLDEAARRFRAEGKGDVETDGPDGPTDR